MTGGTGEINISVLLNDCFDLAVDCSSAGDDFVGCGHVVSSSFFFWLPRQVPSRSLCPDE